ncbi:MAG: Hsp20/alpha crystallin family protein [Bacteroidota bacterium]
MTLLRKAHNGYPTFSNLLEDIFSTVDNGASFRSKDTLPSVNIAENNNEFKIEFAVPGLTKEEFKINLDNNILTVGSEKKEEKEESNENFTRREFNYSSFQRSFTLPDSANGEKIKAEYNNGILNIEIPKREEAKVKPVREIEIQ